MNGPDAVTVVLSIIGMGAVVFHGGRGLYALAVKVWLRRRWEAQAAVRALGGHDVRPVIGLRVALGDMHLGKLLHEKFPDEVPEDFHVTSVAQPVNQAAFVFVGYSSMLSPDYGSMSPFATKEVKGLI